MRILWMIIACTQMILQDVCASEDDLSSAAPAPAAINSTSLLNEMLLDEDWDEQQIKHYDLGYAVDLLKEKGVTPLTLTKLTEEIESFRNVNSLAKIEHIKFRLKELPFLVFGICSAIVGDTQRATLRRMIWNRLCLLRMLSDPDYQREETGEIPSLTPLYRNLSEIDKAALEALKWYRYNNENEKDYETIYQNLTVRCRNFRQRLDSCIPDDLKPWTQ